MKTCCEKNGMKHGCNQGRDCPVRETKMVDGGNFWYAPEPIPEPMTFADRVLLAIIFALAVAVLNGAVRYYLGLP